MLEVTDSSFSQDVINSDVPVLVDFWAPWCGPCKSLAPLLEEIAEDNPSIKVVKLNVDENPKTAQAYNIRSIPCMILFKQGQILDMKIGAGSPKAVLQRWINEEL